MLKLRRKLTGLNVRNSLQNMPQLLKKPQPLKTIM